MGSWPTLTGVGRFQDAANVASSILVSITASGTANTKGSYTQLIASTSFDASGFLLALRASTVSRTYLLDIAVGAAASEQVVLPNILVSVGTGSALPTDLVYLPMAVKAGQRIAARCQSATASAAMTVGVYLVGQT
jgi:hypothetical protein